MIWHHPRGYLGDPFDVVALCRKCHALVHAGTVEDPGLGAKRGRPKHYDRPGGPARRFVTPEQRDEVARLRAFGPEPGDDADTGVAVGV